MDQTWDQTLREHLMDIVEAPDSLEYNLSFLEFVSKIDDSHSFFL